MPRSRRQLTPGSPPIRRSMGARGLRVLLPCLAAALALACSGRSGGSRHAAAGDSAAAVVVENGRTGTRGAAPWTASLVRLIGREEPGGAVTQIGEDDRRPPDVFLSVRGLAVDGLGRIWVLDAGSEALRVFGPDGRFMRSLGGEGKGPGRFGYPDGLAQGPDGRIWVVDPRNRRLTAFDTAGRVDATYGRPGFGYSFLWDGAFSADGRLFDPVRARDGEVIVVRRPEMEPTDTLALPDLEPPAYEERNARGRVTKGMIVPFAPRPAAHVAPTGRIWTTPGSPYRVVELGPAGDTLRVIEREYEPVQVSATERDSAEGSVRSFMGPSADLSRIPVAKPAIQDFRVDARGYLWVQPSMPSDSAARALDVFAPDGRYLGRIRLPVSIALRPAPVFGPDRIVGLHIDSTGAQRVAVLRLELPPE